jgi:hypothetical protein
MLFELYKRNIHDYRQRLHKSAAKIVNSKYKTIVIEYFLGPLFLFKQSKNQDSHY